MTKPNNKRLYYWEVCVNWIEVDEKTYIDFHELDDKEQADFLERNNASDFDRNLYYAYKNSGIRYSQDK
jgi:hypothetical protein